MPRIAKIHALSKRIPELSPSNRPIRRRALRKPLWAAASALAVLTLAGWMLMALEGKATFIKAELETSMQLASGLQDDLTNDRVESGSAKVDQLRVHTAAARKETKHPLWTIASLAPGIGQNFSAVTEIAGTADDVANLAMAPLVQVLHSFEWEDFVPGDSGANLTRIDRVAPGLASAANAVRLSAEKLENIDDSNLLERVSKPLISARLELRTVTRALDSVADASALAPQLLGTESKRHYLLMIQNNAEARASGGIPGALAVLSLDKGKLSLGSQSSAGDIGIMSPIVPLDPEQQRIYSGRAGKFMQDVNLTPDFPTAASTARAMWERKSGQRVDGVISIDPVALGYILDATGPVRITHPEVVALASVGLPTELNGSNVVQTLLSDVYAKIEQPALQDVYFAGVAKEIFAALTASKGNPKGLMEGLTRGTDEGRILVWSGLPREQAVIAKYDLSGSITGPSVAPAQFGVYFNDGTGAKMDYYVKRSVQLVKQCAQDGYEQTTVRITSTNTAPADASTSLPAYVTGGGAFGVPAGSVQTNVVAYGPAQANVETAKVDGQKADFAPYLHSNRPVGVIAVRLAPGESNIVDFTFGRIVQHTEPNVIVTPTIQDIKDVILPTVNANCG